jgi:hypothetical protein
MVIPQRRRATRFANGQPHGGIKAQRIGVILVTPPLAKQHQHRTQQFCQGVGHLV